MSERKAWIFFYGSYMNPNVLKEVDLSPANVQVAKLAGFDLRIAPRANLVPAEGKTVYGVLTQATHRELDRLYTEHAYRVLGEVYVPEAVLVETLDGQFRPAMTYICWTMTQKPPENSYIHRILAPATELNFPAWYLNRIRSFLVPEAC